MSDSKEASVDFEKNLQALEKIVENMENNPLGLDEALKQYEAGIKLSRECQKALTEAELKIDTISQQDLNNNDL